MTSITEAKGIEGWLNRRFGKVSRHADIVKKRRLKVANHATINVKTNDNNMKMITVSDVNSAVDCKDDNAFMRCTKKSLAILNHIGKALWPSNFCTRNIVKNPDQEDIKLPSTLKASMAWAHDRFNGLFPSNKSEIKDEGTKTKEGTLDKKDQEALEQKDLDNTPPLTEFPEHPDASSFIPLPSTSVSEDADANIPPQNKPAKKWAKVLTSADRETQERQAVSASETAGAESHIDLGNTKIIEEELQKKLTEQDNDIKQAREEYERLKEEVEGFEKQLKDDSLSTGSRKSINEQIHAKKSEVAREEMTIKRLTIFRNGFKARADAKVKAIKAAQEKKAQEEKEKNMTPEDRVERSKKDVETLTQKLDGIKAAVKSEDKALPEDERIDKVVQELVLTIALRNAKALIENKGIVSEG